MNVDISPDGNTVVFDLLGDLFTLPSKGGTARQLTRGLAINTRPVWSPDGKKIAYISDFSGSLHVNVIDLELKLHVVLGKSDEQLNYYSYARPVWTPDGNYIAVNNKLYGLSGANQASQMPINNLLRFSFDGKIAYYLDSGKIYAFNREMNTRMAISTLERRSQRNQSWQLSPDGHWWAYIIDSNSQKCLMLKNLTKKTERILVSSLYMKYPYYRIAIDEHFSFSPDSKSIFIGYGGKIHRIDLLTGNDKIIPFYAKVKVDLGAFDYNQFRVSLDTIKVKYTRFANTSPDGKHLVFSALDKLYVMDLPHGKAHTLAPQAIGQFQPVYSPDGKWIAYVSWCDTIGGHVWRVSASGGKPEQLTHVAGQYQRPAWSPDGTMIAVIRGAPQLGKRDDPGTGELQLTPINGGAIRILEDSIPLWNQLTFTPDGKTIIYSPKNGNNDDTIPLLVSKTLEGTDRKVIATGNLNFAPAFVQQRSLSPDGRYIVYSMGEYLYLVPVCNLTGSTHLFDSKQNLTLIRFAQGIDPIWEKNGEFLSWSYANRFYRLRTTKIIAEAEQVQATGRTKHDIVSVNIKPDMTIILKVNILKKPIEETLALKDVRIITMQGSTVIESGTIVIKNGRFTAVGPTSTTLIPPKATILNLSGTTVMPGLIDLHLHMPVPPEIFPQQSWYLLINLAYGVTTARDPSTSLGSFGYQELLQSGQMIGPRLYPSGRPIRLFVEGISYLDNIDDAQARVHQRALFAGTFMKQYALPTRLQRQYLLLASRAAGLNMTNEGYPDLKLAFGTIKDGSTGVEHTPEWSDAYSDLTTFVAKSGIYWTPTLQVGNGSALAKENSNYLYWHQTDSKLLLFMPPSDLENIQRAQITDTTNTGFNYPSMIVAQISKQGGHVAIGSHGNNQGIGVHNELWALQMGGLSNWEALKAATITGAEALGIQKDLGSITIGKIADLIILSRNPLEDIHNSREIRYVMKEGVLYNATTLDEVWPIVKKCPAWKLKPVSSK